MKHIFTSFNQSIRSIKKPLLLACALLAMSGNAWGKYFYAKCRVLSSPEEGGYVYVAQDAVEDDSYSFVDKTDDITSTKKSGYKSSRTTSTSLDFYAYQKANDGYTFKWWATSTTATSGINTLNDHQYNWQGGLFGSYQNNCQYYSLPVTSTSTNQNSPTTGIYYAIFTPNNYKVTLNNHGATTAGTASVTVTYNATTNLTSAITKPTKTGYTFGGYYTAENGGGSKLIGDDGKWIKSVSGYTGASGNNPTWVKAANVTLHAKWTANKYTVELDNHSATTVGTARISVTYDASTNLTATPAITVPAKTDYTFGGYYTAENGGGSQVIAANGNVNANVSGYTDANKKWKYAGDVTLHAKWIENSKTITLDNQSATTAGTTSITVLYKKNNNLTTTPAITVPVRTGYTFEGYYTATNGGGSQIIDKNGNVNASVSGYTDASKNWQYDKDLTLYAYWKQNQSITWNQTISNSVRSTEITLTATAGSGLGVYYTATSNAGTVSISGNKITCLTAGSVTITAHQDGNGSWNAATATKTFTIIEHAITKNPTASGITYEQQLSAATLSGGTANVAGTWAWKNPNTVPNAGIANYVAVFTPSSSVISAYPLECNVSVTVAKATPDVTCNIASSYYVDDATLDLQDLWTREGNGAIEYTKISFTPSGKNNEGATVPAVSNNRYLSLGQAGTLKIQMAIAEGTNYNARTVTKDITINKRPNSLNCSWGSWSKDMYVDSEEAITISSNNSSTPIHVDLIQGDSIAKYANNKVTSNCNLGVAQWSVTQEETYKYKRPTAQTLTATVTVDSNPTCEILLFSYDPDAPASQVGELDLGGAGVKLSFRMKMNWAGDDATLSFYNSSTKTWSSQNVTAASAFSYDNHSFSLGNATDGYHITKIKFAQNTGIINTDDPYINEIRVTRQKYFNLQDAKKVNVSELEMTNYIGGNSTTATFYVDYSTCGDIIKIASNNEHVTVSPTAITTNSKAGRQEITVTYASADAEDINAVITAYTQYDNKTIHVHAATQKKPQDLTWSAVFAGETVSLPMTFACNNAATASTGLPVTYQSGNDKIIEISEDRLSFTVVGSGTTTLTATQEGDDEWQTVSETKTIVATSKKIQHISWAQNLNKAVTIGDNIPLEAKVMVYTNVATGAMVLNETRTNLITYSCPANNGVIEITNDKQIRVIGYGTTTVTAEVDGDDDYEAAAPVEMIVRMREKRTGDCEEALAFEQSEEIEFSETAVGIGTLSRPRIAHTIEISDPIGVPDSLTFDVRGKYYTAPVIGTQHFKGDIEVYESTDGGLSWSGKLTSVTGKVNDIVTSVTVKVSPEITNLMFVRPQGGEGYHYVGNIKITSKSYITTANTTVELGNIASGASLHTFVNLEYSSVKGNLTVAKAANGSAGLTVEDMIYVDCGNVMDYPLEINVAPTKAGDWCDTITIDDPKQPKLSLDIILKATVSKGSQAIVWNPALNITTLQAPTLNAYATSGLDVTYELTDGSDVASIVNGEVVIAKDGTFTITVTQDGDEDYKAAETVTKTFTVSKATPDFDWTKAPTELAANASGTVYAASSSSDGAITYAITAGEDYATIDANTGVLTIQEPDHQITVQASQAETAIYAAPTAITVDVTIAAPLVNNFTNANGDNEWDNPGNWESGVVPTGDPDVIVSGHLVIDEDRTVGELIITAGDTITIKDGYTLTVTGVSPTRDQYGDIVVEAGGQLSFGVSGELKVNDFTLHSAAGDNEHPAKSGQVTEQQQLSIFGKAYFVLELDPRGSADYGWYDFTVPFPVDALNGINRLEGSTWAPMTNGVDYLIMTYYENLRSKGQYPWKTYTGILQPGSGYSITVVNSINIYRFEMNNGGAFKTDTKQAVQITDGNDDRLRGWNAIGNGALTYVKFNDDDLANNLSKVQLYSHTDNAYDAITASDYNFVVGSAYLVQTTATTDLNFEPVAGEATAALRAPQRSEQSEKTDLTVQLAKDGKYNDRLFITCSDEANDYYTIGEDLAKLGTLTESRKGRLWTTAKGDNLCAVHTAYQGNETIIPLQLFAPKADTYTLNLEKSVEEDVYVLYNGIIVWNLAMGEYTFDLETGTDSNYALRVVRRVAETATGIDQIDGDSKNGTDFVEKIIVNDQLYILRDGILYDAQGKRVTNF